jgi:hypothetical protein
MLKDALRFTHAVCFDFAGYFHHFKIDSEAAAKFAIRVQEGEIVKFYVPNVVPTGASEPPLFAQLLSTALATLAASPFGADSYVVHTFIDNIRFCSSTLQDVLAFELRFTALLESMNIALNHDETQQGPRYTFLGIKFDHASQTVGLSEKTRTKLASYANLIGSKTGDIDSESWTLGGALAVFGICVWASSVLGLPRAEYYVIYKFIRKKTWSTDGDTASPITFWDCCRAPWLRWIYSLLSPEALNVDFSEAPVLVTDSSLRGWGAIFFAAGKAERVVAARHVKTVHAEAINYLELRTIRLAICRLDLRDTPLSITVDNTSVASQLRRTNSRVFKYNRELNLLFAELERRNIRLRKISWIASAENPSDGLSRLWDTVQAAQQPDAGSISRIFREAWSAQLCC